MTDKQIFERFMEWMGMVIRDSKETERGLLVIYEDQMHDTPKFTTQGYDEFWSGALFGDDGNMIEGFLDSHVAYTSRNCDRLMKLIDS